MQGDGLGAGQQRDPRGGRRADLMRAAERESRDDAASALFELTAEIADNELRPAAAAAERDGRFPRAEFKLLGRAALLGLPYAADLGGAGQPSYAYRHVVE